MSDPRRLWVRVRHVAPDRRSEYRQAVAAAGRSADGLGAHFWVFELDGEPGRFIEFSEGPHDGVLARLDECASASLAAAGPYTEWRLGVDGLRTTAAYQS